VSAKKTAMLALLSLALGVLATEAREPLGDSFPALREGMGAATLGAGGAGVAMASGMEAIFWNPAGCAFGYESKAHLWISANQAQANGGLPTPLSIAAGLGFKAPFLRRALLFLDTMVCDPTIGFSGFAYNVSDLETIDYDVETGAPLKKNSRQNLLDYAAIVTFCSPVVFSHNRWMLGVNGIAFRRQITNVSTDICSGFDFGTRFVVNVGNDTLWFSPPFVLGSRFRSLSSVTWNGGYLRSDYTDPGWKYLDLGFRIGNEPYVETAHSVWWNYCSIASQVRLDENRDWRLSGGVIMNLKSISVRFGGANLVQSGAKQQENTAVSIGIGWRGSHFSTDLVFRYFLNSTWRTNDGQASLDYGF